MNDKKSCKHAPLVELINRRASLRTGVPVDVFDLLLPVLEETKDKIDVREYLLEHTRHVPRDMVMLFRSLQQYSGDGRMTVGQLFDALADYSRTYFVNEMKDELDGQVSGDEVLRAFRLFTSVRKRIVKINDLESRAVELKYPDSFDLRLVLRLLFDCSAIGNARTVQTYTRNIQFKFRNRFSELNEMEYIVFHRALWKGLDLH
jgi:hypothetical protein